MNRAVWKFSVPDPETTLVAPFCGYEPVLFGRDMHGELCVWYEVIPDGLSRATLSLKVVATGEWWNDNEWNRVATTNDRGLIWHLLVRINR